MNTETTDFNKEISEAISAGEAALSSLNEVEKALKSAMHWGIADILGGGIIVDLFKHSKIDKATLLFQKVQEDLSSFQKELGDVQMVPDLQLEISDCLYTFDVFFDNLFSDIMVQDKIEQSLNNVRSLQDAVKKILEDLRQRG